VKELVTHHVGGYLKIAPEHTEEGPLAHMMKPAMTSYDAFKTMFEKFSKEAAVDVPSDGVVKAFTLPEIEGLSTTYFVRLSLSDATGKTLSTNFYWLSTQPDINDFARGNGRYTPISTYADLTDLQDLPQAKVTVVSRTEVKGEEQVEEDSTSAVTTCHSLLRLLGSRWTGPMNWMRTVF